MRRKARQEPLPTVQELLCGHIRWPRVESDQDANLVDVPHLGLLVIAGRPDLAPVASFPSLAMVERIEKFVSGVQVRCLPVATLYARYLEASDGSPHYFAVMTELWLGCIGMAKLTRVSYVTPTGLVPYTEELRIRGYLRLIAQANHREWVLWGMTLAQELSASRGNQVVTEWIQPTSPYWLSFKGLLQELTP